MGFGPENCALVLYSMSALVTGSGELLEAGKGVG